MGTSPGVQRDSYHCRREAMETPITEHGARRRELNGDKRSAEFIFELAGMDDDPPRLVPNIRAVLRSTSISEIPRSRC
jgi:hypothetical protein